MAARNVLAGAPIAISLIGTATRAIEMVIYRALARAMGAEPALTWSAAAECVHCVRSQAVCAMSFDFAHHPGGRRHLLLALRS